MVVNPAKLLSEIETLREAGVTVSPERLRISFAAHLITPAHLAMDAAQEKARGSESIGTTRRGIGPAYTDKVARHGLRVGEMLALETWGDAVVRHVEAVNQRLTKIYGAQPLDPVQVAAEYVRYADTFAPFIDDVSGLLNNALMEGKRILAEGAQGTLLDLDHGTYPFVTSSHPTAAGALVGLGLGVRHIHRVVGVTKAFQTRVGSGPFPTEVEDMVASHLRGTGAQPWDEYGTTTGRPRRVGWLDIVLLRYAVQVNGFTELALTKLDVLTGLDPVRICVAYRSGADTFQHLPLGPSDLSGFEPVYETLPGWHQNVRECRRWEALPIEAQRYVERVEALSGVPVRLVSVGPERNEILEK
jgi:adenylosuccinate synthase